MLKSFNSLLGIGPGASSGQLKLRVFLIVLLLLNAAAFYFYFDPPGGSQQDLAEQDQQIRNQISAMNVRGTHMRQMALRVETGSSQIADFEKEYFLPKRIAYGAVIEEIQRMAKASGLQERDAGFSEEPIEGTNDLSLLTIKANYEGPYPSMIKFLYETDRSPMLLMLDSLTAAPEQKNGQISSDIRFQVVIQDQPLALEQQMISDQIKKEKAQAEASQATIVEVDPAKPAPTKAAAAPHANPPVPTPSAQVPIVSQTPQMNQPPVARQIPPQPMQQLPQMPPQQRQVPLCKLP